MKIHTNCIDCDVELTVDNRGKSRGQTSCDSYAAFCKDCWSERCRISDEIGTEFKCNRCGWDLEQDEDDLWRIFCPICKEEKRLQQIH